MNNEQENKEYVIERLSRDNLQDLEQLFKDVYGYNAARNYFYKKYDTAYTGVSYTGFIAYTKEHYPVCYYGVIPCFFQYGNETMLAAQSADTMTHPLHRYKGLWSQLSAHTFSLCRIEGIRLIFGFPNQNFYNPSMHKLRWQTIEKMDYFKIAVNTIPLEAMVKRIKWLGSFYKWYVKKRLARFQLPRQPIASSVLADGYAGVKRDNAYFKYKTYSDTVILDISDSKLWMKIKDGFIIGEIELNGNDLYKVIDSLKKLSRQLGVPAIYFQCSPGTHLHSLFMKDFKATPSFPVIIYDLDSGIPTGKIKFTFADIDIF